jgi:hypothetical protein
MGTIELDKDFFKEILNRYFLKSLDISFLIILFQIILAVFPIFVSGKS